MKYSSESRVFYTMLAISLALNLFLLPVIAGNWFWSSRLIHSFMDELHPAEVKTVALRPPKPHPPVPKLKPQVVHPIPHALHPGRQARKSTPTPPHPHVMAVEGNAGKESGTSTVIQGTGQVGVPTLPTAPPTPPPPPPRGETRGAVALASPVPQIPDSLRSQVLKTFVRARFDIAADGTAQVTLLTSSGSPELDQLTLDSLRQWKWKPALQNGAAVPSTQRLRIEFEVL